MPVSQRDVLSASDTLAPLVHAAVGDLGHALVVESDSSLGAAFYARALGRSLNCQADRTGPRGSRPCGECDPCRLTEAGSFGAMRELWPVGVAITIAQVQEVIRDVTAKFGDNVIKVFLLHAADQMQEPAANALLKTLEEPPRNTVFLLATGAAHRLLSTIRSRCRRVRVGLPGDEAITLWLGLTGHARARLFAGLTVAGRHPEALLDLVAHKTELDGFAGPASVAAHLEFLASAAKAAKKVKGLAPHQTTALHAVLEGGWYGLHLAVALSHQLERLARNPSRIEALEAAAQLHALQVKVAAETEKAVEARLEDLVEIYGSSYEHPLLGPDGKVGLSTSRNHVTVLMRALVWVLGQALHRFVGTLGDGDVVAPVDGLSMVGVEGLASLSGLIQTARTRLGQNVALGFVLDDLFLSIRDVLALRPRRLAAVGE